jgi:predicted protein tyrosine phosphatase
MGQLIITSYWFAREQIENLRPRFVLSLMDPTSNFYLPQVDSVEVHETIWVHDIASEASEFGRPCVAPSLEHVQFVIELAQRWGFEDRVLIHCMAGVSRSAAAGLIYLSALNPSRIGQVASLMRSAGPWLSPNPLMVNLADNALHLNGRLMAAHNSMGAARMHGVVQPVALPMPA